MPHVAPPCRPPAALGLSIVAPAHNEEANLAALIAEVDEVLNSTGLDFELIVVDDGSTDGSAAILREQMRAYPRLRAFRLLGTPSGRGSGQSAAFHAAIRRARGTLIAMIDADCQNDPRDLPRMVSHLRKTGCDLVQGDRSANRRDSGVRRMSSAVGRTFRRLLLGDTIRDTGCSLRVMTADVALALPLQYAGLHRFIPYYARRLGFDVVEMAVGHRPRVAGRSKYGIWNRALPGLRDLRGVAWMSSRLRPVACEEIESDGVTGSR